MEISLPCRFIIMALDPVKGRIRIDDLHFRYSLTAAAIMDLFNSGEISLEDNRVIPSFRRNGVQWHDMFAERIENTRKNKTISFWIRTLVRKHRLVFRENTGILINRGLLRHEKRFFLNVFPYNRYYISDPELRTGLIRDIKDILLNGKKPDKTDISLAGLITASKAFFLLSDDNKERKLLKEKCIELMAGDPIASETVKVIKQVSAAISAAVIAASAGR